MRTRITRLLTVLSLPVLIAGTCSNPVWPPPVLNAPSFQDREIVTVWDSREEMYREAVHLTWNAPPTASVSIHPYKILRYVEVDSTVALEEIPDSVREFFDPTYRLFRSSGSRLFFQTVYYRVFAVDSMGRSGDTSVACTVTLAPKAELTEPGAVLTVPRFSWVYHEFASPAETWIEVRNIDSVIWRSPRFRKNFSHVEHTRCTVPDSVFAEGERYWWEAQVVVVSPVPKLPASVTVGAFDVDY